MSNQEIGKVTVLAFEKKLIPSDGIMYGVNWENRTEKSSPLSIIEKSVRGTISNRLKKKEGNDTAKLDNKIENPNLHKIDSCSLESGQDTLKLNFTLKILSGVEHPSACNNDKFYQSYLEMVEDYKKDCGFGELAKRYAINIANARYLWRNRVGAENLEVIVKIVNNNDGNSSEITFDDPTSIGIKNFDSSNENLVKIKQEIESSLSGKKEFVLFDVTAFSRLGKAQEVYPSEELVLDQDKGKGVKDKILYQVKGKAAMHSQKIGNALRTIDTWYPGFAEKKTGPIAIEPYGAVTNLGTAFRKPKEKKDFYTLFDRYARGDNSLSKDEKHYVMAVLIRGGIFGESSKE
ncbi:MAG: type I-F CRISPR-associated protein Csy3 [Halobacteriovoraceae bacterium]|nr:type I-F CRISPR-associated protein Csy3 [Halobacteriovoraceae bacterium]